MNRELAMKVANAVLYEGYMLYPYRPSALKNRQRWSFGILYPPEYHEVAAGTERAAMHSECLVKVESDARLHVQLRFLQLVSDGRDEVAERSVDGETALSKTWAPRSSPLLAGAGQLVAQPTAPPSPKEGENGAPQVWFERFTFSGPANNAISGGVAVRVDPIRDGIFRLAIDVTNGSALAGDPRDRDSALLTSLLSAHTILSVAGGEFVSLLDPSDDLREAVSQCQNSGNFPVLVGAEGERDMMLCSPILLYDYPQIAPESAGNFFDGTEMDEMLTLRVMTLTDEEKQEMLNANDHVRELLQRTEASAREQLMRTHGTIRSLRPVNEP